MKTGKSIKKIHFFGLLIFFPLSCQIQKPEVKSSPQDALKVSAMSMQASVQQSSSIVPVSNAVVASPLVQATVTQSTPVTNVPVTFQSKLAEINARPVLLDKIIGIKELLSLITTASPQADKDSFIAVCNDLFANQGTMKKNELIALKELFEALGTNKLLLAPAQRTAMEQLFTSIKGVLDLADDNQPLVVAVKNKIEQDKQDYSLALNAAFGAINLFNIKLSSDEYNRNNPKSFVAILREKIPVLYNNRAGKKLQDLQLLNSILSLGQTKKDIANVIGKSWPDTVAFDVALASAKEQKNILSQLAALQDMSKLINAQTDRYEKGLFVDMVTNIFTHRSQRAAKEIDVLKNLIDSLSSGDFVKNRVFDTSVTTGFNTWKKILEATNNLLALDAAKSADQKIAGLIKVLPNVILPAADYEKMLFVTMFLNVFIKRSEIVEVKPDVIKTFLLAIKNTSPGLLAPNQLAMLTQWLEEVSTKS